MSDTTEASRGPKIRVCLKTGRKPDPQAPAIGFVRWQLMMPTIEPGVQKDEGQADRVKRTP